MAKKKKKEKCPPLALWLVTFSDLVTLLLTFFVLLLTMSSMDTTILTRVTLSEADLSILDKRGSGRVQPKQSLVIELLQKPWEVMNQKDRLKDLLYPDDVLPKEMTKSDLDENLDILARNDGVALVFTDSLLFEPGGSALSPAGMQLIDQLIPIVMFNDAPLNVAGHTSAGEGAADAVALSGERAMSVLAFLVEAGVPNARLSVSAYGDAFPVLDEMGRPVENAAMNRRVELLLKTARPIGGYQ